MIIARNHTGHRIGESHHRAKLSTAKVLSMREDREKHGMTYAELKKKYGCSESTVRDICKYITRWNG